jgi:hypothetical protein
MEKVTIVGDQRADILVQETDKVPRSGPFRKS